MPGCTLLYPCVNACWPILGVRGPGAVVACVGGEGYAEGGRGVCKSCGGWRDQTQAA